MTEWVGRWWSVLSQSWMEVVSASSVSVRVRDARGDFDLTPEEVERKISSGQWVRSQP